jgi:hypothetical protein
MAAGGDTIALVHSGMDSSNKTLLKSEALYKVRHAINWQPHHWFGCGYLLYVPTLYGSAQTHCLRQSNVLLQYCLLASSFVTHSYLMYSVALCPCQIKMVLCYLLVSSISR